MNDTSPKLDHQALLRRASDTIERLERKLARMEQARREPIAIIGMGMRLPGGANDAASFWQLLYEGVDAVTEVPSERWDVDAYFDPNPDTPGKTITRWGAFLNDVDKFDPRFFGISPREAAAMDPQQRLLLEVSWEALENAGHASARLAGSATGVFVGMVGTDYATMALGDLAVLDGHLGTGTSRSIAAGRIAYAFGLLGPAVCVDTACSSSAVATHLACLSLRAGECDLALAGGSNLALLPDGFISASRGRMMSPTGRCRTFDASADGYVRGEGCAMIALRRLSDALEAGDNVLAVILASVTNQDGRSNGLTAPNGRSQEALLRAAVAESGVDPGAIGFVEAHGTGTSLGDPVEVQALGNVFAASHSHERPLMLGSVKTNIGHLEAVAGTAGLIKLVLALQHRTLPPQLHLRRPNPHIPWGLAAGDGSDGGHALAGRRGRPPARRGQLVRFQRHQLAHDSRRGAGRGRTAGGEPARPPREPVSAHTGSAGRACRAVRAAARRSAADDARRRRADREHRAYARGGAPRPGRLVDRRSRAEARRVAGG